MPKRLRLAFTINFSGIKQTGQANAFFDEGFGNIVKQYLNGNVANIKNISIPKLTPIMEKQYNLKANNDIIKMNKGTAAIYSEYRKKMISNASSRLKYKKD